MFRFLAEQPEHTVQLRINDQEISVPKGSSVWAAMAVAGETTTRLASVTEQERSAYCAMGVCFECLVEVDGVPNRQACLLEAREGMHVQRQVITQETSLQYLTPDATRISASEAVQLFDARNEKEASC